MQLCLKNLQNYEYEKDEKYLGIKTTSAVPLLPKPVHAIPMQLPSAIIIFYSYMINTLHYMVADQ